MGVGVLVFHIIIASSCVVYPVLYPWLPGAVPGRLLYPAATTKQVVVNVTQQVTRPLLASHSFTLIFLNTADSSLSWLAGPWGRLVSMNERTYGISNQSINHRRRCLGYQ